MTFTWRKKGLLLPPESEGKTHATAPCVLHLGDDRYRLFYTKRDDQGRSEIHDITIRIQKENILVEEYGTNPVLIHGPLGAHDEFGAMSSCVLHWQGRILMYFTGWTRLMSVPVCFTIGLAEADSPEGKFQKLSEGPVLGRDFSNPYLAGSAYVIPERDKLIMWFVSCQKWKLDQGDTKHYYHICQATSQDGIHWTTEPKPTIDFKSPLEYAIARPSVYNDEHGYLMWYCYRASKTSPDYLMGYAQSDDGKNWIRKDDLVGIEPSDLGWDSQSICYPHVFRHNDTFFMLYNGNGYGASGFGYAVCNAHSTARHS